MSKQLWLQNGPALVHRGNNDAKFNGSASWWTPLLLAEARGSSLTTASAASIAGTTNGIEFGPASAPNEWISEPLAADFTISGTITLNLWGYESTMNDNTAINASIDKIDGVTGALTQIAKSVRVTELAISTSAVNNFTVTPTSTAIKRGDRLRVRVFIDDAGASMIVGTSTFRYNGPTAAADGDSYVQFTENLTFEPAGDPNPGGGGSYTYKNQTDTSWGSQVMGTSATTDTYLAAPFIAPNPSLGPLAEVIVNFSKSSNPVDNVIVELCADNSGVPGTVIGTIATVVGSTLPPGQGVATTWTGLSFPLTAGVKYWIKFRRDGALSAVNCYVLEIGNTNSDFPALKYGNTFQSTSPAAATMSLGFGVSGGGGGANKYYLLDSAEPAISTAALEKQAKTTRGSSNVTATTNTAAGPIAGYGNQIRDTGAGTVIEWYTPPLLAVTLGGKAKFNITAAESNVAANASLGAEIAVVNGDGSGAVVWGYSNIQSDAGGGELPTVPTASFAWVAGDDLAITDGKRLRFRIYTDDYAFGPQVTGQTVQVVYNGATGGAAGDTFVLLPVNVTEQILTTPKSGTDSGTAAESAVASPKPDFTTLIDDFNRTDSFTQGSAYTFADIGGYSGSDRIAQLFVASGNKLISASAYMYATGSPSDTLTVEIRDNAGGVPGSSILGTVASVSATSIGGAGWYTWNCNITLTQGTAYWLVFRRSSGIDTSNYLNIAYSNGVASGWTQHYKTAPGNVNSWQSGFSGSLACGFILDEIPIYAGAGAAIWKTNRVDSMLSTKNVVSGGQAASPVLDHCVSAINLASDFDLLWDCVVGGTQGTTFYFCGTNTGTSTYNINTLGFDPGSNAWWGTVITNGSGGSQGNVAGVLPQSGETFWISKRGSGINLYKKPTVGGAFTLIGHWDYANLGAGAIGFAFGDSTQRWDNVRGGPFVTFVNSSDYGGAADFTQYVNSVMSASPRAYWRLGASPLVDASGNGNTLSVLGTAPAIAAGLISTDPADGSRDFTANGCYSAANATSLNVSYPLTLEAWVVLDSITGLSGTGGIQELIRRDDNQGYILRLNNANVEYYYNDGGWKNVLTTDNPLVIGQKTHIVVTDDGTTISFYVNGVLNKSAARPSAGANFGTGPLIIGGIYQSNAPGYFIDGRVDEVAIYNSALSPAAVAQHYNLGIAAPTSSESAVISTPPVPISGTDSGGISETASVTAVLSSTDVDGSNPEVVTLTTTRSAADANGATTEAQTEIAKPIATDTNSTTTEGTTLTSITPISDTDASGAVTESVNKISTTADTSGVVSETLTLVSAAAVPDANGLATETALLLAKPIATDANGAITESTGTRLGASDTNGTVTEGITQTSLVTVTDANGATSEVGNLSTQNLKADTDANSLTTEAISQVAQAATTESGTASDTANLSVPISSVDSGSVSENASTAASPLPITGLALWLDASQLALADGAAVDPWPNLTNPALPGAMVGTPVPKVHASTLNNLPVVKFAVSEGRLRINGTGIDLNYTLVYIARMVPGGTSVGRIVNGIYQPANILFGYWNGFEDVAYAGSFLGPDVRKAVTNNWHLYSADAQSVTEPLHDDYQPRLFSDGVVLNSGATMTEGWKGTFAISGYDPTTAAETCDCEIAEVLFYNRKLSDTERQTVEGYLRNKWMPAAAPVSGFDTGGASETATVVITVSTPDSNAVTAEAASVKYVLAPALDSNSIVTEAVALLAKPIMTDASSAAVDVITTKASAVADQNGTLTEAAALTVTTADQNSTIEITALVASLTAIDTNGVALEAGGTGTIKGDSDLNSTTTEAVALSRAVTDIGGAISEVALETYRPNSTDAGTAANTESVLKPTAIGSTDTGTASETASPRFLASGGTDTGLGADSASPRFLAAQSDTNGTITETATVLRVYLVADAGTATDSAAVLLKTYLLADTGTGDDSVQLTWAVISQSDFATATETTNIDVVMFETGIPVDMAHALISVSSSPHYAGILSANGLARSELLDVTGSTHTILRTGLGSATLRKVT